MELLVDCVDGELPILTMTLMMLSSAAAARAVISVVGRSGKLAASVPVRLLRVENFELQF